jgi:hypothetical protein
MRFWSQSGTIVGLAWCSWMSLGCDAQVGDEYTGDVMFELRGHVVAPPNESSDLVPALAFYTQGTAGGEDTFGHASKVVIMDGKLEGVFPSDFRLKVAGPPPMPPKNLGVAMGYVVLVPRDHVPSFEMPYSTSAALSYPDIEDDNLVIEHREYCSITGECFERDYTCVKHPCELIAEAGDPEHAEANASYGTSACLPDVCYYQNASCNHEQSCYRQTYRCDVSAAGAELERDHVSVCTKTAERGETSLKLLDEYALVASNLTVIYATGDDPVGASLFGIEGLKAGYNLVELAAANSEQTFLDYADCRFDASVQALAEVNEANGTQYGYDDAELDSDAVWERFGQLTREGCPAYRVIADPSAVAVDLNLSQQL